MRQEKKEAERRDSLARLFLAGLWALSARRARALGEGVWRFAMGAVGVAAGSASLALSATLSGVALIVSAGPYAAPLLLRAPELNEQRVQAFGWAGLGLWAMAPMVLGACALARRFSPPDPLSAQALQTVNATRWVWLQESVRLWHEGGHELFIRVNDAANQAALSKGALGPMGRLLGWLALAPIGFSLLVGCVAPWASLRAVEGAWRLAQAGWERLRSIGGSAALARESLGGSAPAGSPAQGLSLAAARAWAGKKALEVVEAGSGAQGAARAQRAQLEKELGEAKPGKEPSRRL